jgi:hypothetical protein
MKTKILTYVVYYTKQYLYDLLSAGIKLGSSFINAYVLNSYNEDIRP